MPQTKTKAQIVLYCAVSAFDAGVNVENVPKLSIFNLGLYDRREMLHSQIPNQAFKLSLFHLGLDERKEMLHTKTNEKIL